jgi:hypothetical protein
VATRHPRANYPHAIRRPSFPTVISLIALFVALGGTSYAVIKLPAKSVGNRELKSNAVTSAKIRARAIARSDLSPAARVGSRGPRGATGPAGTSGAPGDAVAPEAWKALPFSGPWGNYGFGYMNGAYRKDQRGRVYLRGLVTKVGGTPASGDVIATLPAGYRPSARSVFVVGSGGTSVGEVYGRADLTPAGEIIWIAGGIGEEEHMSMETVSFWGD